MRRDPLNIRSDIHRLSEQRSNTFRALSERPEAARVIAESRVELDTRLVWLWEELREAMSPRGYRQKIAA